MDSTTYTLTTTSTNVDSGTMTAFVVIYLIVALLFAVPALIVMWRLFSKAGKPGWAAIVPIYNYIVELQIAKLPLWYVVLLFVPFVNFVVAVYTLVKFAQQYDRGVGFWLTYVFLPIVTIFLVKDAHYKGGEGVVSEAAATTAEPVAAPALVDAQPTEQPADATPASGDTAPVAAVTEPAQPETPAEPEQQVSEEPQQAVESVEVPAEVTPSEQTESLSEIVTEPTSEEPAAPPTDESAGESIPVTVNNGESAPAPSEVNPETAEEETEPTADGEKPEKQTPPSA